MSRITRLINGKGDWNDTPPTGASDADLYQMANDFVVQGGVIDLDGGDALVTQSDTPGLSVVVAPGIIYVPNSTWEENTNEPKFYQVVGDTEETLVISSNSSGSTRVDLVAQKIDKITTPNDDASNVSPLVIVEGTPGDGEPALPDDHELLAVVTVEDGATEITNDDIEDRRRQVYLDTKDINNDFVDFVDGATITLNLANKKNKFKGTILANRPFAISNAKEGDEIYLRITMSGGPYTPVWPSGITWFGIEDNPDLSDYVDANKTAVIVLVCTAEDVPAYDGFFLGAEE